MALRLEQDHSAVFHDATWQDYWAIRERVESTRQVTYDGERIEIMASPVSLGHEDSKTLIARLLELYCFIGNVPIEGVGNLTLTDEDLDRGCESDEAYYVRTPKPDQETGILDLKIHLPPDLVIEIDMSSRSVSKEPVYAAMGVAEVWRWEQGDLTVRRLEEGRYVTHDDSLLLPELSIHDLGDHVRLGRRLPQHEVLRRWAARIRA
jgi:Uma2 family endonuclease